MAAPRHLRGETAWAPLHVGKELRLARLAAFDADLGAIRAATEADAARKAGDHERAARQEHLAASYRALRNRYQQREQTLTQAMAARQEWELATAHSRRLAITADTELRRRHPDQKIEPTLRATDLALFSGTEREQLNPALSSKFNDRAVWTRDLATQRQLLPAKLNERQRLMMPSQDPDRGDGETFPSSKPLVRMRSCGLLSHR